MNQVRHPVVDFDHHSAEFNVDPHHAWQSLREQCPVAWSEEYGGYWIVSDYEGNHEVLKNTDVFTSERPADNPRYSGLSVPGQPERDLVFYPEEQDPPHHAPVRRLINAHLSPAEAQRMIPEIERWTTTFIDDDIESGSCDLLEEITGPVPAFVTLSWLGYPHDRIRAAADMMHGIFGYAPNSERWLQAVQSNEVEGTLWELCAARRAEPKDDFISWAVRQTVNGEPVGDDVIVGLCFVLVAGGVDTTSSLTASALVHLNRDHELRRRLVEEPDLLVSATEEFLRFYPPLSSGARRARQDVVLRGCPIQNGDRVLVSRYGANFDEGAFDRPEEFIPDRFPNRHVSFGLGPHRCAGSHLARLMFQEMIRQILRRMPDYRLDESQLQPYPDRGMADGWVALPATFTPGPRVGRPS
jgi:cytochrome P450